MSCDSWITRQSEPYEEPPLPVDPRDEAYTEAVEEIARLKKVIERLEREVLVLQRGQTSLIS
jgi:hypothetical protein